ncbi:Uncharacterized hydrolase YxeP [Raoultella planticola]|uniref:Uncharacterized hydrolase YxeP n=1 Tax=Raoultella planticola TaxID=575 RepID=A0A485ALC4_RAOPL|nr:Uncharacterized hydrolase YxeP [Raoultella planticola]
MTGTPPRFSYAAEYLARTRQFNGTPTADFFSPAEELLYGGRVMVEDGLFDKFPCDRIFGLHNMPGQAVGKIGLRDGAMMALLRYPCILRSRGWAGTGRYRSIPLTPRWLPVTSRWRCNPSFRVISRHLNRPVVTVRQYSGRDMRAKHYQR